MIGVRSNDKIPYQKNQHNPSQSFMPWKNRIRSKLPWWGWDLQKRVIAKSHKTVLKDEYAKDSYLTEMIEIQ